MANYGYCGEVSLISAGLYYGQYCSQYTARSLAAPGVSQANPNSQLLLGVNAVQAAKAMKLNPATFNTVGQTTNAQFADWIGKEVLQDRPVLIGVLMNYYKFYGMTNGGDPDYDHIVPIVGINYTSTTAFSNSLVYWSDNGLWAPNNNPPYRFNGNFSSLFKSRSQANAATAPIYSINNNKMDYGMSISGVMDTYKNTIRVKLATNVSYEQPSIQEGSNTKPSSMPLELTATVEIPDQTVAYNLYLYNAFASVPTSNFNGNAVKASQVWRIPSTVGSRYTVKVTIKSDAVAVFRAVRATAP